MVVRWHLIELYYILVMIVRQMSTQLTRIAQYCLRSMCHTLATTLCSSTKSQLIKMQKCPLYSLAQMRPAKAECKYLINKNIKYNCKNIAKVKVRSCVLHSHNDTVNPRHYTRLEMYISSITTKMLLHIFYPKDHYQGKSSIMTIASPHWQTTLSEMR